MALLINDHNDVRILPDALLSPRPGEDDAASSGGEAIVDEGTSAAVPEEMRCKYPSKYCGRTRARKSNGTCHRFCQYHRIKANTNQKRWTSVRRQQAAFEDQQRRIDEMLALGVSSKPLHAATPYDQWMPALLPDPVRLEHGADPVLSIEDVHILNALLASELPRDAPMKHSSMPTLPPVAWSSLRSMREPPSKVLAGVLSE